MDRVKGNIEILSLNVYYGQLRDELETFIRGRIADVSVFCFQETNLMARQITDEVLSDGYTGFHASKAGLNDMHYLSMYIRRDIDFDDIELIHDGVEYAGFAQRCRLYSPDGEPLIVSNVYGTPRPGHKLDTPERLSLSNELVSLARESATTEVMMGDFNLMPEAESIRMFSDNGFLNLIDEFNIPTTRNEIAWHKFPEHMRQLYADYTFVRGDGVDYSFVVEDVTVSDHLPMTIRLALDHSREYDYQGDVREQSIRVAV